MAHLKLRDRDAIITKEGLIFRVFGYTHPRSAWVCDVEYALDTIFKSDNRKALRSNGKRVFYKFYEDEGWKFIQDSFPRYMIFHEMLGSKVVGVNTCDIVRVRKPEAELQRLLETDPKDELLAGMEHVLEFTVLNSGLAVADFGVFGSLLHGFHHPRFSDIDLIVYGRKRVAKLCEALNNMYESHSSLLKNEFDTGHALAGKKWKFKNLTPQEFVWHQRRKLIYALFNDQNSRRVIKTEFEPVKEWSEMNSEYSSDARIVQEGWCKMSAVITEDEDALFMPSIYGIEPLRILEGPNEAINARRIISYMEEFRMQAVRNETAYVEGSLEKVTTTSGDFFQIALTYCPKYYEQVLKTTGPR